MVANFFECCTHTTLIEPTSLSITDSWLDAGNLVKLDCASYRDRPFAIIGLQRRIPSKRNFSLRWLRSCPFRLCILPIAITDWMALYTAHCYYWLNGFVYCPLLLLIEWLCILPIAITDWMALYTAHCYYWLNGFVYCPLLLLIEWLCILPIAITDWMA